MEFGMSLRIRSALVGHRSDLYLRNLEASYLALPANITLTLAWRTDMTEIFKHVKISLKRAAKEHQTKLLNDLDKHF